MNTLIYNYFTGPIPAWAEACHRSAEAWARRLGCDYTLFTDPCPAEGWGYLGPPHPFWGTFYPWLHPHIDLPAYDAVLYLDSDCLVSDRAPDLFAAYPSFHADPPDPGPPIAMLHLLDGPCRRGKAEEVAAFCALHNPKSLIYSAWAHANAGVVLWPSTATIRHFRDALRRSFNAWRDYATTPHPDYGNRIPYGCHDQTILNSYRAEYGAARLPCTWNYHLTQFDPDHPIADQAHIIHYHDTHKSEIPSPLPLAK